MKRLLLSLGLGLALNACSFTRDTPAPIINVTSPTRMPDSAPVAKPQAAANRSAAPAATTINKINQDQDDTKIENARPAALANKQNSSSAVADNTPTGPATQIGGIEWFKPTAGKIVHPYNSATKGVDVAGNEGQPIFAAADGKVVYSGNGLKGYGNLIIIKHTDNYLTAYSHNKVNLVKEGDLVKRRQQIAELGKTDSDKPILHFELRKKGKPLNPTSIFDN